ncbi:MAG TPA: amidase [Chloroflexota bacterium]|nr:amidase [Chloroflexota bacterium]
MSDADLQREDLELRRETMRRAIERVWSYDAGEAAPAGGFRLAREGEAAAEPRAMRDWRPSGEPREGSAAFLAKGYRNGELSPVEITQRALRAAEESQPRINAFITILGESALAEARAAEERFRRREPLGPLDGVPIGIKDLVHMEGVRTTSGSKIMADFVAIEDAPVIRRLRAGGAVIIGKTNLHEFAYGGTGDASYFGPCRNPHNPEHLPGGSSSGSAAAVAAGICPMALGTDTAGSIRMPGSLCGVVGLKPTYGRVPKDGVIPLSWSQDHVGPLAATVEDAALSLAVMSDFQMPDLTAMAGKRLRIGVCRELFFEHLDGEVRRLVEAAIARLGDVREVKIPHLLLGNAAQAVITATEAGAFHHRWLESRPDDYVWTVGNRLKATSETTGRDYVQALRLRGLLVQEMAAALKDVDVLASPTMAVPAPRIGQREVQLEDGPADVTALMVRNTAPMNYAGFPAITLPCGKASNGLPVGLQLAGLPWQEDRLLQAAYAFEQMSV